MSSSELNYIIERKQTLLLNDSGKYVTFVCGKKCFTRPPVCFAWVDAVILDIFDKKNKNEKKVQHSITMLSALVLKDQSYYITRNKDGLNESIWFTGGGYLPIFFLNIYY